MRIRAAVSRAGSAPFVIEDVELRDPRTDEILVRLVATGICHTDLTVKAMAGVASAVVLGHEGAGVVERVGPAVRGVRPGDHVVLTFASCGSCDPCRAGGPSYCDRVRPAQLGRRAGFGRRHALRCRRADRRLLLRAVQLCHACADAVRQHRGRSPDARPRHGRATRLWCPDRCRGGPQRAATRRGLDVADPRTRRCGPRRPDGGEGHRSRERHRRGSGRVAARGRPHARRKPGAGSVGRPGGHRPASTPEAARAMPSTRPRTPRSSRRPSTRWRSGVSWSSSGSVWESSRSMDVS